MLEILGVEPRDVCVVLRISVKDLDKILLALDKAELVYDEKHDPKKAEAAEFLINTFYPQLSELLDHVREEK